MPSSSVPPQKSSSDPEPLTPLSQSYNTSAPLPKRTPSRPPWYYRLIMTLLKPLYRLQVWRRSHKHDNYQQEVAQRFGKQYPPRPMAGAYNTDFNGTDINNIHSNNNSLHNKVIWCHAVSLGETNTVAPLLDALLAQGYQIWLTNTTQTGHARGASRFADEIAQGRMSHSYVPVDTPAVIKTFLAHVQPVAALFVETELWANILAMLTQQCIPSILVNGRLSAASFVRYQKISAVSRSMMQNLTLIIAQDSPSAKRFRQLGAYSSQIRVGGSLKWVINTPKLDDINTENVITTVSQKDTLVSESWSQNRPIWVAASTHSGEETAVLALQQQLLSLSKLADTLLIIVPRHPERFDEVAALIQEAGLQMARRSADEEVTAQTQVYLADTMGELMHWYALADAALVGGSLVDVGGHNPVEPASVATPIVMGRYTQSCQSVVDKLASVGALYQPHNDYYRPIRADESLIKYDNLAHQQSSLNVDDSTLMYQQLQFWLINPPVAKLAGQAGAEVTEQQQSVLACQLTMIQETIKPFTTAEP